MMTQVVKTRSHSLKTYVLMIMNILNQVLTRKLLPKMYC